MRRSLLRIWFATFAPPMPDSVWGGSLQYGDDSYRLTYLAVVALWRFEYADAMLDHLDRNP